VTDQISKDLRMSCYRIYCQNAAITLIFYLLALLNSMYNKDSVSPFIDCSFIFPFGAIEQYV
jgi:hypothetical protein